MAFEEHPYYEQSQTDDWLPVPRDELLDGDGSGPRAALVRTLRSEQERICTLALDRIPRAHGAKDVAERPHPERNDVLFVPIGERGFRVYVEYGFFRRPGENRPDNDFWWTIMSCAYALEPFPTGKS